MGNTSAPHQLVLLKKTFIKDFLDSIRLVFTFIFTVCGFIDAERDIREENIPR